MSTSEPIFNKTEIDSRRHTEIRLVGAKGQGRTGWEFDTNGCKLLYAGRTNNKVLLWSTEKYIHSPEINHTGKEYQKKNVCMCATESLVCTDQFSRSVVSDSWPHGLQDARPPCPSPTPRIYSNSCPLSQWCHPTISSSVTPFSSCLQSFPATGPFLISWLFV